MRSCSESFFKKCFYVGALALSVIHYLAAVYLPISDSDETFNFVEPIHFLLYGTGKQTWENCSEYCLRNWVFTLLYASPAFVRYRVLPAVVTAVSKSCSLGLLHNGSLTGSSFLMIWYEWVTREPRSVDVYFFQRIFYGQMACLAELFFVSSLWVSYGRSARHVSLIALGLLCTSSAIPHAGVSVLPTSFAMISFFLALGCWLRSGVVVWDSNASSLGRNKEEEEEEQRRGGAVQKSFSVPSAGVVPPRVFCAPSSASAPFYAMAAVVIAVIIVLVGWPFAGLVALPMLLDLLLRYPDLTILSGVASTLITGSVVLYMDSFFFCQRAFSVWNIVVYNVLGGGDATLYGVESWVYFYKNLLVNFHFVFVLALASPVVVLLGRRQPPYFLRLTKAHSLTHPSGKKHMELTLLSRYYTPVHSRISELAYISTFFLWFVFWHFPPHKEERFMAPAYPSLVLAATLTLSRVLIRSAAGDAELAETTQLRRGWQMASRVAAQDDKEEEEKGHQKEIKKGGAPRSSTRRHKIVVGEGERNDPVSKSPTPLGGNSLTSDHTNKNYHGPPTTEERGGGGTIRQRRALSSRTESENPERGHMSREEVHALPETLLKRRTISRYRWGVLVFFLLATAALSASRGAALHYFYSGPQQLLYDAYPTLSLAATQKWERSGARLSEMERVRSSASSSGSDSRHTAALPSALPASSVMFQLCVGREWYRFPSSFFLDHYLPPPFPTNISKEEGRIQLSYYEYESYAFPRKPIAKYGFLKTSAFNGALPLDFFRHSPHVSGLLNRSTFLPPPSDSPPLTVSDAIVPRVGTIPKACLCASALVNDLNLPIEEQYVVPAPEACDALLDSFYAGAGEERAREAGEVHLDAFPRSLVSHGRYRLLDTSRTPMWCRVLYYPFGVTDSCAVWRELLLQGKEIEEEVSRIEVEA